MNKNVPLLDSKNAEKPIKLPENPYWTSLKDFGLDEVVAGIIDAGATTGVNAFLDPELKTSVLPFVGPVLEKIGFFPIHLKKAYDIYSTMPKDKRQKLRVYFKQAMKDGTSNLMKDLTIHDPLYITFMSVGLTQTPEIPPGILSAFSYITAVLMVGAIDVAKDETLFLNKKNMLKRAGFNSEKYFESRFHILAEQDQNKLLDIMMKEFNLENLRTSHYHDIYLGNHFPTYSGRTVKIRLRDRDTTSYERENFHNNHPHVRSLQVVYTRAREENGGLDQCRYFPVKKQKIYYMLSDERSVDEMPEKPKAALKKYLNNTSSEVTFDRTVANNNDLAICTDKIIAEKPYYVLELKTYDNIKLMKQAMRYLMVECPIVSIQTTYGKSDMAF